MSELTRPLMGWRVLVPRGGPWGDGVAAALRRIGATPVIAPMINFAPTDDSAALDDALRRLAAGEFDWITATSATVVDVLAHHRAEIPPTTRVAAVGETTAAAFTALGYTVSKVPGRDNSAAGLLEEWDEVRTGRRLRILTLRSDVAKPVLTSGLIDLGHDVTQVVAYRTIGMPVADQIREDVASGRFQAILITSGSVAQQIKDQFEELPADVLLACVGPQTQRDAEALGLHVNVVADERTVESLLQAVVSVADNMAGE